MSICSCTDSNPIYSTDLIFHKKIEIPIDADIYYESKAIFSFEDPRTQKEYLSYENNAKGQHEIIVFDLETGGLVKRVNVEFEGPNAIFMFGHFPIDLNNFYVTSTALQTIYKISDEGTIVDHFNYSSTNSEQMLSYSFSSTWIYNPLIIKDSCFYLTQEPMFFAMGEDEWKKSPLCAKVSMKDKRVTKLPLSYPVLTKRKISGDELSDFDFGYCRDFDGEKFIYSFYRKDDILVTKDHISSEKHSAKSRYAKDIKPILSSSTDIFSSMKENLEHALYWHFVYDKYRNIYYRFVFFPCTLDVADSKTLRELSSVRQEFSVIVMNDKFEIIGETKFPKNKYSPKMFFIGKKGLYISENNPLNPEFDEDKLVFSCFVLE